VTANHVLRPVLVSGALTPALIWALAAVVLPRITSIRALSARVVLVTVWAAVLASATATALNHAGLAVRPGAAGLGALCSAILALLPSLLRWWRPDPRPTDTQAGLA
jgi:eukaryotic-like serine/threonine-protein kinase